MTRVDAMIEMGRIASLMKDENLTVTEAIAEFFKRGYTQQDMKTIFEITEKGFSTTNVVKAWRKLQKLSLKQEKIPSVELIKVGTALSRFNKLNNKDYSSLRHKYGCYKLEWLIIELGLVHKGISEDQRKLYSASELMKVLKKYSDQFNEI